jgi:hypothetical protein
MIITSHNSKGISFPGNPTALESALLGNYPPPSLFARSNLLATLQAPSALDHRTSRMINPTVSKLLELEASNAFVASRANQPSSWLMNSLLVNNTLQRQMSPIMFQQLQQTSRGVASLNLFRSASSIAQPATYIAKKTKIDATSPINTILVASSGKRHWVEEPSSLDVLCGRGGRSNHHPGNKIYRQVVSDMKASYRNIGSKSAKTDLSRAIVDHVFKDGGRFVKMDKASGKFIILTTYEARKKTSQALREPKDAKWTA